MWRQRDRLLALVEHWSWSSKISHPRVNHAVLQTDVKDNQEFRGKETWPIVADLEKPWGIPVGSDRNHPMGYLLLLTGGWDFWAHRMSTVSLGWNFQSRWQLNTHIIISSLPRDRTHRVKENKRKKMMATKFWMLKSRWIMITNLEEPK